MVKINYKEVCVVTRCPFCGRGNEVEVNEMDYWDWQDGVLVQVAFPYLSVEDREKLINGTCSSCWSKMFSLPEEEEEDIEDFDDSDLEIGFDPYMGCYTDDC